MATIPGGVFGNAPWITLLDGASAVIIVVDAQASTDVLGRALQKLETLGGIPGVGCVVLSKAELLSEDVIHSKSSCVMDELGTRAPAWRLFVTRVDRPDTLVEPIDWLLGSIPPAR